MPLSNDSELLLVGVSSSSPTGPSVSFKMLTDGLDRRGISYDFVNLSPKKHTHRRVGDFSWQRLFEVFTIFLRYLPYLARGNRTVYLLIGQSRVGFFRDCLLIWPAILLGHRVVAHLKGGNYDSFYESQPGWLQPCITQTFRRVDTIIVLSHSLKSCFGFLEQQSKIVVVPNGLPIDLAHRVQPVRIDSDGPIRLLYLSNMIQSKGYWRLLEACKILKGRGVPFDCDFCGEFLASNDDVVQLSSGEARRRFIDAVEAWGLSDQVKWRGVVRGEEKYERLEDAHVFVLPTTYVNEGQPVSIIEALAFGKVVISTNYRAISDLVVDQWNGFLLNPAEPGQIADRVEWLLRNPGKLSQMSARSLVRYRQNFTSERHLRSLLRILLRERR